MNLYQFACYFKHRYLAVSIHSGLLCLVTDLIDTLGELLFTKARRDVMADQHLSVLRKVGMNFGPYSLYCHLSERHSRAMQKVLSWIECCKLVKAVDEVKFLMLVEAGFD